MTKANRPRIMLTGSPVIFPNIKVPLLIEQMGGSLVAVVFAQSEVISLIARKYDRSDILAGVHLSIAKRIIKMMKRNQKSGDILMTGGSALPPGNVEGGNPVRLLQRRRCAAGKRQHYHGGNSAGTGTISKFSLEKTQGKW